VVVDVEVVDEVVDVELVDEDVAIDVELVDDVVAVAEVELVGAVVVWSADVSGAVSPSPEHAASTATASNHGGRTTAGPYRSLVASRVVVR
jgi:hypothetical protein